MIIFSNSVEETRTLGARIASQSKAGDVYALEGDLGTGKTEFVRGFCSFLGTENVRSPSFSILNSYSTPLFAVYHFDFYRLADVSELDNIGFFEYVSSDGVCLIEWGTLFSEILPVYVKLIKFKDSGIRVRSIECCFDLL